MKARLTQIASGARFITAMMQEKAFRFRNAMFLIRYAEAGSTARKGIAQPARTTQNAILTGSAQMEVGAAQGSALIIMPIRALNMANAAKNAAMM